MTAAEILAAARKVMRDGFALLADEITPEIEAAFRSRAVQVAAQLSIGGSTRGIVDKASAKYAKERAGELIRDFAKSTPEMLRATVEQSIKEGWSGGRLRDELREHYAFSPERALSIARTEPAIARRAGGKAAANEVGAQSKKWDCADDPCSACLNNQAAGWIGIDEEFPEGDDPHPNCTCGVEYRSEPADDQNGDDDDDE